MITFNMTEFFEQKEDEQPNWDRYKEFYDAFVNQP